ncbi:MAG TPA: hypothetical protein GXX28_07030 [Firmicutes bacterium]|nr:hypothetical protein [Bacillota bacterium]
MTKDEFRPIMRSLTVALPPRQRTAQELQELFDVYFEALKGLTAEQFERAVANCQNECERFPTIADVKRLAGEGGGGQVPNATAYEPADIERTMMAPVQFLDYYGVCNAEGCPGLADPSKCDGTFGGRVPQGYCGWERWMVFRAARWLRRTGRIFPPNLLRWEAEQQKPQLADIPALEGETKSA